MKIGFVRRAEGGLIPSVSVELNNASTSPKSIDALLDSGFTGAISLPSEIVDELQLDWSGEHSVTLADASEVSVDLYEGFVSFAGVQHRCAVLATGDMPTIGMRLLEGSRVSFEAVAGGDVEIEPLPE